MVKAAKGENVYWGIAVCAGNWDEGMLCCGRELAGMGIQEGLDCKECKLTTARRTRRTCEFADF